MLLKVENQMCLDCSCIMVVVLIIILYDLMVEMKVSYGVHKSLAMTNCCSKGIVYV